MSQSVSQQLFTPFPWMDFNEIFMVDGFYGWLVGAGSSVSMVDV